MKKLYTTLIFLITAIISHAQTFDYSLRFLGTNMATDNYQFALVVTPSSTVATGNTSDMAFGFYVPAGLSLGNFETGDSGIPAAEWTPTFMANNANGDGFFASRFPGPTNIYITGNGPFQLLKFDVIATPNPTSGSIDLIENSDPIWMPWFIDNYIEIDTDGRGTSDHYNMLDPAANSISFSTLSTPDIELQDELNVYPNPVKDILNIATENTAISYSLFNVLGQQVRINGSLNSNTTKSINISELPDGIYILNTEDENNKFKKSFKLIKKK